MPVSGYTRGNRDRAGVVGKRRGGGNGDASRQSLTWDEMHSCVENWVNPHLWVVFRIRRIVGFWKKCQPDSGLVVVRH